MSWPSDPSRDLVSHHNDILLKSSNCTYLSPCSERLTFSIHQTSFIYCWELTFYIVLLRSPPVAISFVKKRTIRHHTLMGLISSPLPLPFYDYSAVGSKMAISQSRASLDHTPSLELEGLGARLHGLLDAASITLWDVNIFIAFCA